MSKNAIVATFLDALMTNDDAYSRYVSNRDWTRLATAALVTAGVVNSSGERVQAAARCNADSGYGRSEYLTLDVCVYDDATWGPPLFVAEHENVRDIAKVQYCAWKVLSTHARQRVLVAYYRESDGMNGLVAKVRDVASAFRPDAVSGGLLVIGAPWNARPTNNRELRSLFHDAIVELG